MPSSSAAADTASPPRTTSPASTAWPGRGAGERLDRRRKPGRNTTIIRSNYLFDGSAALYDHALKSGEGLTQELNYNVM